MKTPTDSSWTMKNLFSLRKEGQLFIWLVVGNGQSTFLWLDNWHSLGHLYLKLGDRVVFNLGRSLGAKISSIIENGRWKWPRGRSTVIAEIIANTTVIFCQMKHVRIELFGLSLSFR